MKIEMMMKMIIMYTDPEESEEDTILEGSVEAEEAITIHEEELIENILKKAV